MEKVYDKILYAKKKGKKLLAILLDPDKLELSQIAEAAKKLNNNKVDFIFVGGSTVKNGITDLFVKELKKSTIIPIVLFPGDYSQITKEAHAVLFLFLLSGRNPEYLIEQQIKSVPLLENTNLEVISTGYILIEGGVETAVQKVSNTQPIAQENIKKIVNTACAGMYLGNKLIYLEAGSGAKNVVNKAVIKEVSNKTNIPIIVGGGIRNQKQLEMAYKNGADLVVIGTAFEENNQVLNKILKNESIY
ncbi:MAG: geranylgeranylglyceryl/heptaprenylglyceryl phosphate synthase [Flavobacteriaceae bacterium]|nr:geranylgeranylglyceryl/heptaprenylglyceryl phosphate synthase [Flavobacteriaceae bacterium]